MTLLKSGRPPVRHYAGLEGVIKPAIACPSANECRFFVPLQLLADTGSGHNITHSVFVECGSMYRADGPTELKPVGRNRPTPRPPQ